MLYEAVRRFLFHFRCPTAEPPLTEPAPPACSEPSAVLFGEISLMLVTALRGRLCI
jgi:hypothetical protein